MPTGKRPRAAAMADNDDNDYIKVDDESNPSRLR